MFPEVKLCIFGLDENKLSDFTFADDTFSITSIPDDLSIDHAFECVGGEGSPKAINQIIDYINPEGTISILGVSENPVAINSGRKDFEKTIALYQSNPEIVEYLQNIIGATVNVHTVEDMKKAFELDRQNAFGKTIMIWNK